MKWNETRLCPSSTVIQYFLFYGVASCLQELQYRRPTVPVHFRPDESVSNLRRLQAHTKTLSAVIRELLYADDCALAHTLSDAQQLFDRFREAACRFGLTVSLNKTEVMMKPSPNTAYIPPVIQASDITLNAVDKFCSLGSILANTVNSDKKA